MFNHPTLIACGYLFTRACSSLRYPLYQKRIRAENGDTLYFVEITDCFDALQAEQARLDLPSEWLENNRYSASVILYTAEEWDPHCQHELKFGINAQTSLKQIEDKVAKAFVALGCITNPYN